MVLRGLRSVILVMAAFALGVMNGGAGARMAAMPSKPPHTPIERFTQPIRPAGLWDKPNQACMNRCQVFVKKGCFTQLSQKDPAADASEILEKCDEKYSICLYDCMCETCDENQIILEKQ